MSQRCPASLRLRSGEGGESYCSRVATTLPRSALIAPTPRTSQPVHDWRWADLAQYDGARRSTATGRSMPPLQAAARHMHGYLRRQRLRGRSRYITWRCAQTLAVCPERNLKLRVRRKLPTRPNLSANTAVNSSPSYHDRLVLVSSSPARRSPTWVSQFQSSSPPFSARRRCVRPASCARRTRIMLTGIYPGILMVRPCFTYCDGIWIERAV